MGKMIGSAIVGYIVMFVVVFLLFSAAYLALGASGAFQPGTWDPSGVWILLSIAIGVVAGIAGGYVCKAIAKDAMGPKILIGIVIVLGLLFAIPVFTSSPDVVATARPETVPMFDAMSNAKQPGWVALLNPILGVVGVLLGAKMYKKNQA